ncbi:MAG: sulfur carrier protein ThiS [Armatimonadota bacterium]|nr:sulfur carrier protein ThiS [Armatimonadota bacterium]
MQISVNGKPATCTDNVTIVELLKEQKVETPEYVSVELNGTILDRKDFDSMMVSEGDQIEFLYFMGGGAK